MKIDDKMPQVAANPFRDDRAQKRKAEADSGSAAKAAPVRDEVAFSPPVRLIGGGRPISDFSGIRTDMVNDLKQKIKSGEYQVSGNEVAEKMLEKLRKLKDSKDK